VRQRGRATLAMKNANGTANTMSMTVTATAISTVRNATSRYTAVVMISR
jgi:hypothetical protein